MAISQVSGTSQSAATSGSQTAPTATSGVDKLANESTFLQLFIAQLKNQDPMNPQDGTQFIAQLAQFSNLEQTIQMNTAIGGIKTDLENYIGSAGSGTSGSSSNSSATGSTGSTQG